MAVFFIFLDHLQDHYLWLLGLLFMIEPFLDYSVERYHEWADHIVSHRVRTRVAISLSIAAAFVACFLTFRDEYNSSQQEHTAVEKALAERDEARHQRDSNVSPAIVIV